jgi:hypothetical protein
LHHYLFTVQQLVRMHAKHIHLGDGETRFQKPLFRSKE